MKRVATYKGRSLWIEGVHSFFIDKGDGTLKTVTTKAAYRLFHKAHGKVHNFRWLFKEVFGLDWDKTLIAKRRRNGHKRDKRMV